MGHKTGKKPMAKKHAASKFPRWIYVYRDGNDYYAYETPLECCEVNRAVLVGTYELKETHNLSLRVVQVEVK